MATTDMVTVIAKFLETVSSAWKTYLETREEAYVRSRDKSMRKAIDYAEKYIIMNQTLGHEKENKDLVKLKEKFFKYNN